MAPGGPWRDVLGRPLLVNRCVDTHVYDPCFFKEEDGAVYLLAKERLVKVDGASGDLIWERSYPEFAKQHIPTVSRFWPFVVSGEPVASIDSVVTITRNAIWTSLVLGWELEVFGRELIHQRRTFLVALDPDTGDIVASYPIPDSSEGGELYLDVLAVNASIAARAPYRYLLPFAMRTPAPVGGIVAFRPATEGVDLTPE